MTFEASLTYEAKLAMRPLIFISYNVGMVKEVPNPACFLEINITIFHIRANVSYLHIAKPFYLRTNFSPNMLKICPVLPAI